MADEAHVSELIEQYERDGYVVLHGMLTSAELDELRAALEPYLRDGMSGRNDFEGERTKRVYSLVGRGEPFERTVLHPRVLALLDRLLEHNYLLTASQAICIYPGETPQPVHFDDTFYRIARPRKAVSVSTIWAVDDFTAENGGTDIIPGSHLWTDEEVRDAYGGPLNQGAPFSSTPPSLTKQLVPLEMPAGSCVVFAGTLLHRGGQNRSRGTRSAFSNQYCEPWARQQENYFLSVPHERAAKMPRRLREMLGYSIHPPFMGQVAGRHPQKVLEPGYVNSLVADDMAVGKSNQR